MKKNHLARAIKILGGDSAVSRLLGLTPKAVRKWRLAGKLPRTEATGETNYAEQMASADPRISKQSLIDTVYVVKRAA